MVEKWIERLNALAPHYRSRGLDQRIFDEILVKAESFTPEKKEEFKDSAELLGEIMLAHGEYQEKNGAFGDMFGDWMIYHEQMNERGGQFFTPINVCDCMVAMALGSDEEKLKDKPQKFLDPAGGSGRFMLRTAKWYAEKIGGYNFIFWNIDIDFRVFVYCTMNAILNAIPSINIHGESLAPKFWDCFAVVPVNGLPTWHRIDPKKVEDELRMSMPVGGQRTLGDLKSPVIVAESRPPRPAPRIIEAEIIEKPKKRTLEDFLR